MLTIVVAPCRRYRFQARNFRRNLCFWIFVTQRSKRMDQDNRVLGRKGARELSEQEVEGVTGALRVRHTLTPCFVDRKQQLLNGDQAIGECGG